MVRSPKAVRRRLPPNYFGVELCSGHGSTAKLAAEILGIRFITVDNSTKFGKPDLQLDILDTRRVVKKIKGLAAAEGQTVCAVAWVSAPCQQYSRAKTRGPPRDLEAADSLVTAARQICKDLGAETVILENPGTGLLHGRKVVSDIPEVYDVDYCAYGANYRKHTKLWCTRDLRAFGFNPERCKNHKQRGQLLCRAAFRHPTTGCIRHLDNFPQLKLAQRVSVPKQLVNQIFQPVLQLLLSDLATPQRSAAAAAAVPAVVAASQSAAAAATAAAARLLAGRAVGRPQQPKFHIAAAYAVSSDPPLAAAGRAAAAAAAAAGVSSAADEPSMLETSISNADTANSSVMAICMSGGVGAVAAASPQAAAAVKLQALCSRQWQAIPAPQQQQQQQASHAGDADQHQAQQQDEHTCAHLPHPQQQQQQQQEEEETDVSNNSQHYPSHLPPAARHSAKRQCRRCNPTLNYIEGAAMINTDLQLLVKLMGHDSLQRVWIGDLALYAGTSDPMECTFGSEQAQQQVSKAYARYCKQQQQQQLA